ncbi:MAG: hypothetical protein AAF417_10760 [Pseudomonadota bacterium]
MAHRTLCGTIEYISDGVGVEGSESFRILCFPDGTRMLRAHSEMFNDNLVRETLLTVNEAWQPQTAQMHLMLDDRYVGAGQYTFSSGEVHLHRHTARGGSQDHREPIQTPAFGGHAVQNDAWLFAASDRQRENDAETLLENVVISSRLPNGADGPALLLSNQRHVFVGNEDVDTKAGRFETRHYEFRFDGKPPIHYWINGEDYVLVRARWDLLRQTYDLVSLTRDE